MNEAAQEEHWRALAFAGDWSDLLAATEGSFDPHARVFVTLWRSRAFRALGRGEAANEALLSTAQGVYEARAAQVAELAEELIQCAHYEAAAQIAARLQAADAPEGDYVWAILWREREDWAQYRTAIARLTLRGEPWVSLARIQDAWAMLRQGRLARAAETLFPLLNNPHPGVQKLQARLELARGQHEAARVRLEQVGKAQPLDWEWPPLLALALTPGLSKDASPRLLGLYEKGLQRQPRQAEAYVNRARLRLALGDRSGAEADTNSALALKPWLDAPVLFWVQEAVSRRDFDRAQSVLDVARRQQDTPKRAAATLDLLRIKGTKREEIVPVAEALVRQFPNDATALRTAGAAFQIAKQFDRAATCYARALKEVPDDIDARNNLALLYRERGDLEEAIAIWRAYIPDANDTVRLNYALSLVERGDRLDAEAHFRSVLERAPRNSVALRGMAEVAYAAGEDEKAWGYARASLDADPKNPLAWRVAAGIVRRREGEAAAIDLLEQGAAHAQPVLPVRKALFQRWRSVLDNGELRRRLEAWCAETPEEAEYCLMAADAAHDVNDFEYCEKKLREAYTCAASEGGTALVRFYLSRERGGAARRVAEQLVRDAPQVMRHWGLLAEVLYRQERVDEALAALDNGLKLEPTRLALVRQKVGILLARERFDEGVATARVLAEAEPLPPQLALLSNAMRRAGRPDEMIAIFEKRLAGNAKDRVLRLMHASALRHAGRHEAALTALAELYRDEPGNFMVVQRYVRALSAAERLPEALVVLRELAGRSDDRPDLLVAVAELLRHEGALEEARQLLSAAVTQHPNHLALWQQLAALEKRAQDTAAEAQILRSILTRFKSQRWTGFAIPDLVRLQLVEQMQSELNAWREAEPANVAPWWAAFRAAKEMKNYPLALELLGKIEALRGSQPEVHSARAKLLEEGWQLGEATAELRKAIALRPDNVGYQEQLFSTLVKAGDFDEVDQLMARLEHLLGDSRYARFRNFFFNINCHPSWSQADIWRFYKDWYERSVRPSLPPPKSFRSSADPARKLRIGYVSPDFRRHAVAYFSEALLVEHDREQFELFAYAHLEIGQEDAYTARFKTYFHHWVETRGMSDDELERRIREDGIDILVDLAGHTTNNRLSVFLRRPAPVQASWIWGAGQTTGLPQVDYFITDATSVPAECDEYFAESIVRLPNVGLPIKPAHDALEPVPVPCIKRGYVTFGVLARPLRTNRKTVAVWAEILKRVPSAILRFDHVPYAEPDVQQRLLAYFLEHGISAERLEFRNTRPHWRAYHEIDIQLDPFPAGSGTTVTEAFYMERLSVSLKSRPPMGRIPYGQIAAMGLEECCVADTEALYIDKAVAIAADCRRLVELSSGLRERMRGSRLMDYRQYGQDAASLYRQMWQAWCERKEHQRCQE